MIRSTFYGFNIAFSGLMTAQKALDLTGNNMTNINTPGYSRQRLDLNSIPSSNFLDRYAPANNVAIGGGVNVTKVAQLRDPFLDRRFRNEAAAIGELDAHLSVMTEISRIFDEVQFEQGLYKAIQDFRTQLQRYSTQTGEVTLDSTVASAANSMLTMFQMYAVQIQNVRDYQMSLLNGHGGSVPEINKMLENIALLNKNIRECEIYGNPALELKDQRNLLLDQLSAYIKIEVSYERDKDPNLAKMGIEVLRVEFISDSNPPLGLENRTLVHGVNYTNLKVGTNTDGKVYVYKETPQPNNITKRPNEITDPFPGGVPLYFGANPARLSEIDPSEIPMPALYSFDAFGNLFFDDAGTSRQLFRRDTTDGTHVGSVLLSNGSTAYLFFGQGTSTGTTDPVTGMELFTLPPGTTPNAAGLVPAPSQELSFMTGALRGALDMLNSKGAFDVPPNTLNGIGYYEDILDRIVADFADEFNKANQASNRALVITNQHQADLARHAADLLTFNNYNTAHGYIGTVGSDWDNYASDLVAAGVITMPVPTNREDYFKPPISNHPNYFPPSSPPLGSTYNIPGPPPRDPGAPPAYPQALTDFYADVAAYNAAYLLNPNAVPPKSLAPYFDHDFADLKAYAAGVNSGAITHPDDSLLLKPLLTRPLFESNDGGPINAKNVMIAEGWKNGSYMLTTTHKVAMNADDNVSGDTSNLMYMLTLFEKSFRFTTGGIDAAGANQIFTGNFEQMFKIIGLNAANDASAEQKALAANANVIMGIEDLRNSLSSVSMDEEGVNLLRFQKSYAAAARVMTTLDEALEVLINRTGIVGR